MKLSPIALRPVFALVFRHVTLIAILFGVFFNGWLLWQGWQQWTELPLPPERVTGRQLRVSETQRQTLMQNIQMYQQPSALPTVPSANFKNSSSS